MFREMRRKGQRLTDDEALEILNKSTSGVLALEGEDGYPYAVPLSYAFDGEHIYFHSAPEGHKLDAIRRNSKASFCVISEDNVVAEKFTTMYRSVIVFGKARIIEDTAEKYGALEKLGKKYAPNHPGGLRKEMDSFIDHLKIIEFTPEHITGKEAIELAQIKKQK